MIWPKPGGKSPDPPAMFPLKLRGNIQSLMTLIPDQYQGNLLLSLTHAYVRSRKGSVGALSFDYPNANDKSEARCNPSIFLLELVLFSSPHGNIWTSPMEQGLIRKHQQEQHWLIQVRRQSFFNVVYECIESHCVELRGPSKKDT